MFRLICACGVFAVCALFGAVKSESLRLRLKTAEMLLSDLNSLASSLRYEKKAALPIAERLAGSGRLKELWSSLGEALESGKSFGEAWAVCGKDLPLDKEEAEAARAFAEGFGSGDVGSELAKLELTIAAFGDSLERKKREYPNKQKLAGTLSVLFGVAAALLIL